MAPTPDFYASPRALIESGKITIPELYEWNTRENPSHPIFRFVSGHGIRNITYAEMSKAVLCVARLVSSLVGPGTGKRHVIAVVASAGSLLTVQYTFTLIVWL